MTSAALNKEGIKTSYFHSLSGWKRTPSCDIKGKGLAAFKKKTSPNISVLITDPFRIRNKGFHNEMNDHCVFANNLARLLNVPNGPFSANELTTQAGNEPPGSSSSV